MFHSLFKISPVLRSRNFRFLELKLLSSTSPKKPSKSIGKVEAEQLYTVNYLITTFGFSPEKSQSYCKYFTFQTPDKPDSVINFLHNYGFSKTQISRIASLRPGILISDPEKTLLPKIEFLESLGFSRTDVISVLSAEPRLFHRSVEKQLMPSVSFLSTFIPIKDEFVASLKCYRNLLTSDIETHLIPNIHYIKDLGVLQSNISKMLRHLPKSLSANHVKFKEIVDNVKEIGLNPLNFSFLLAIHVFHGMSTETLQKKLQLYKSWGFSLEEIHHAFRKHPQFLTHSPKKITDVMHYLVNKMGFKNTLVIERPQVMDYGLQKTIIPRCYVYQILSDKKLVPKNCSVALLLDSTEKKFE